MNGIQKQYKTTLSIIGLTMIIWIILFNVLAVAYQFADLFAADIFGETAGEIISSVVYDLVYLGIFMIPVAFFRLLSKGRRVEPMRFEFGFESPIKTFALIVGGIAAAFAFAHLNSIFMGFINIPKPENFFSEPYIQITDRGLILQFITIALVPAFCEEFLFRGVILSNLMPYGRSTAIVISSLLFGLMHGNFYQFLYTTVAGLVLGFIYVKTGSIWCSTLMHMLNNSISILQTAVLDRFNDEYAETLWIAFEGLLFAVGAVCIVYLVSVYGRPKRTHREVPANVFGKRLEKDLSFGASAALPASEAVKSFFTPTIVVFVVYSIFNAVIVLFAV